MMRLDELIAGRFELEHEAGSGGMARVFRALDITTGDRVALKLLHRSSESGLHRFRREAAILCGLRHPAIVRYVAHGQSASGEPFLAMEWLDGLDLEQLLVSGALGVAETLTLGKTVLAALAEAHRGGVVHRDVKPANIFLVDGSLAKPKLLDFGIARDDAATQGLTRTGSILGTPAFMAPEQARGESDIDARADVYAVGGVLFACLAGHPPFDAANVAAILAKIVLETAPDLALLRPDVPEALASLIGSALAKQRDARPNDASQLAEALDRVRPDLQTWIAPPRAGIQEQQQRVVSVVLATGIADQTPLFAGGTLDLRGGVFQRLADGSGVVTIAGPESPSDLAARAVRCALKLKRGGGAVSVATGRSSLAEGAAVGELISRAALGLERSGDGVRVDTATAELTEGRFNAEIDDAGASVRAWEHDHVDRVRTLLGKPTRCAGRARELAALAGYYEECVSESVARVLLVTADAGIGKSRLARELVSRLSSQDQRLTVLFAVAESVRSGSPFSMASSALRRAGAITDADSSSERRRKLGARLERHAAVSATTREFLVEMLAEPDDEAPSDAVRAARESPALMYEQVCAAWMSWLGAECEAGPVLLVMEDLHWGDAPSVSIVDAALRAFAERPFMVLALARPEVSELFPKLWSAHTPHVIPLDPLTKRAAEQLVREALGADAVDSVVSSITQRAGGNAFFLEELVRSSASGAIAELPDGLIGLVQLRFDALATEARQALFAASVFGEHFPVEGVRALVDGRVDVDRALAELVASELVVRANSPIVAARCYFRHALTRDAAYALLPAADRRRCHGIAGDHLEREGGQDPALLAKHFDAAGAAERAAVWLVRAGQQALDGNDLSGAIAHATRAFEQSKDPATQGAAALLTAEAETWGARLDEARQAAERATELLPQGQGQWYASVGLLITAAGQTGDNHTVAEWVQRLMAIEPESEVLSAAVLCLSRGISQLPWAERGALAREALALVDRRIVGHKLDAHAAGRLDFARAYCALDTGAIDECRAALLRSAISYERAGCARDALQSKLLAAMSRGFCGDVEVAKQELAACVDEAAQLRADYLVQWGRFELAMMDVLVGAHQQAAPLFDQVSEGVRQAPLFASGRFVATAHQLMKDQEFEALREEIEIVRPLALSARYRAALTAYEARVELALGDRARARALAQEALDGLERVQGMRADLYLSGYSAALETLSLMDEATCQDAIRRHVARLDDIAAQISDPGWRTSFLSRLPWNANVRSLAKRLGV